TFRKIEKNRQNCTSLLVDTRIYAPPRSRMGSAHDDARAMTARRASNRVRFEAGGFNFSCASSRDGERTMRVAESRAGPGFGPPLGTIDMDAKQPVKIRLAHRFGVPPQRVFDAWTDSKTAGQWLFPAGASICVEIDARAGGWFYIAGRRNGEMAEYVGEYL